MPVNLRQYNLKPNSNYNVSLSLKKGDRIIDGLRSIYVSTPKYLTTGIENISTASTIIFDRSYQRNTIQEPSVKITSAIPGRSASTQILYRDIKSVKVLTSGSIKWDVNKHYYLDGRVNRPADEDTVLVEITLTSAFTWKGTISLSSNNPNLIWMNFAHKVNLTKDSTFKVSITPKAIDPSIYWDGRGYWASTIMANLVKGVTPKDSEVGRISYTVEHPEKDAVPGSSVNIDGIYQDVQGLTQTLKTSVQNQDLISQLYWDDVDEGTEPHDVPLSALIKWLSYPNVRDKLRWGQSDAAFGESEAKSIAYLIQRKIKHYGTEGTNFFTNVVKSGIFDDMASALADSMEQDILAILNNQIDKINSR